MSKNGGSKGSGKSYSTVPKISAVGNGNDTATIETIAGSDVALTEQAHLLAEQYGNAGGDGKKGTATTFTSSSSSSSYEDAPWYNCLVFEWMAPLLAKGNSKPQLDPSDLTEWPLPQACRTHSVNEAFGREWSAAMAEAKKAAAADNDKNKEHSPLLFNNADSSSSVSSSPSLAWCLAHAFGGDFVRAGLFKLGHDLLIFVGPQVLNQMIQFLRNVDAPLWHGFLLTATVTCSQLGMSFCLRHYFFKCYLTGLKIRSSIITAIYHKSLCIAAHERQTRSTGEITNLMSVDAQRLQDLVTYLHAIWYSFLQISLAIYFLWQQLGVSCLGGVAVIIFMMPVTKTVAQWMGGKQKRLMKAKDLRVDINNEVLGQMKVLKFQAWESSFRDKIMSLRSTELQVLWNYFLANSCSIMLWSAVPLLVALSTFAAYVLSGHTLDVAEALTALALFEILRFPLFMLPQVINNIVEAMISLERVRSFLLCDEHTVLPEPASKSTGKNSNGNTTETLASIHIRNNASFVYESKRPTEIAEKESSVGKKKSKRKNVHTPSPAAMKHISDAQWQIALLKSQLNDAEQQIRELEWGNHDDVNDDMEHHEEDYNHTTPQTNASLESSTQPSGPDMNTLLSLKRVNLDIGTKRDSNGQPRGELIVVVGAVGSGKSTLLNAILGEVRALQNSNSNSDGIVEVKGNVSYFSQTPFILNDTVKGNILFGSSNNNSGDGGKGQSKTSTTPMDRQRYKNALKVCALQKDLQMLPGGDLCEIGEKGITLSGGQKARIGMARAVYFNAPIYLLDDPLAAVDAHVGRHLFHKCILQHLMGYEKDSKTDSGGNNADENSKATPKTVVLVTNALQYLSHPRVDRILVLNEGRIQEQGTYRELTTGERGEQSLFSTFLKSFNDSLGEKHTANAANSAGPSPAMTPNVSASSLNILDDVSENPDLAKVLAPVSPARRAGSSSSTRSLIKRQLSNSNGRIASIGSVRSVDGEKEDGAHDEPGQEQPQQESGMTMTNEFAERDIGHVSLKVYASWARAAGGLWVAVLIVLATMQVEAINILSRWWLTYWSTHGESGSDDSSSSGGTETDNESSTQSTGNSQMFYLMIYGIINMSAVLATFCRLLVITLGGIRASKQLFSRLLNHVLLAPMAFFDVTPIGRIVNRFSKDMYTIDEQLVATVRSYLGTMGSVCSTIVVVSSITPWFAVCLIPIIGYYSLQSKFFTKSYRELKRLDSVSRSPMYALLGETLDGISTIRAYQAQKSLMTRLTDILDLQQTAYFLTFSAQCWLAVRLELVGTLIITFACLFAVLEHHNMAGNEQFAGLAGLSISYALSVTQSLNWSVRMSSDLEANMISVERVEQYCRLPSEAAREESVDAALTTQRPPWPAQGEIIFQNVKMRYRPNLPLVLKGLSLTIPPEAKVGIVGRTGAGKSTLMVALLRIVELDSGSLHIDGVDIKTIGLTLLRSKMAVIPQDPCLFTGNIRSNLDPFDEYTNDRLYEVLRRVGLFEKVNVVSSNNNGGNSNSNTRRRGSNGALISNHNNTAASSAVTSLDDKVLEGGSNFSVGQRQLLVIARALLKETKIVIMDEATAAVDAETDARIQKVMRTEFKNATTLTVAHRLNTIMDSTHILVMEGGQAAEFDSPATLLQKPAGEGLFKDLVDTWEQEHGS